MSKSSSSSAVASQFLFDKEMTYLNHGSFGACPRVVFEDYQNWQRKLEFNPVQFITKEFKSANIRSKTAVASLVNCDQEDLVLTPNPTFAFNTVIRSLDLKPSEEILSTNLEYGAMDRTWEYYCSKSGAKYIRQKITLPIKNKEEFLEEFWAGLTKRTKYIFISEITSTTALILPVKDICKKAQELGLITIIDGAHVPGHIDLDIKKMNPDFYTGACHKWLLTPKGSTFLYTKKKHQNLIDPLVISWGYDAEYPSESQYLDYLEYSGTNDNAAFLTLPAAFKFFEEAQWFEKTANCRKWIREIYPEFCELVGSKPLCPISQEFLGQICSIPIRTNDSIALKELLYDDYRIEIPVMKMRDQAFIRISLQPYNSKANLDHLKKALKEIMDEHPYLLF